MESTGRVDNVREKRGRDDRVLPETRWLSAIIIPFLVVAFGILYLLPDHTQELFACTVSHWYHWPDYPTHQYLSVPAT